MADVKITGNISKEIENLTAKLKDMTPVFKDIADLELSATRLRFTKEVDPNGNKWPEPFTVRRDGGGNRSQEFRNPWGYVVASNYHAAPPGYHFFDPARGDKILRDTGNLFNSIGRAYGPNFAIVGTNVDYARKNQEGDGVKARPFLGINQKTYENIKNLTEFYLTGAKS